MKTFISFLLSFTCVQDKTDKHISIKKTNKFKRTSVSPRDEFDLKPCATVSLKKEKKKFMTAQTIPFPTQGSSTETAPRASITEGVFS